MLSAVLLGFAVVSNSSGLWVGDIEVGIFAGILIIRGRCVGIENAWSEEDVLFPALKSMLKRPISMSTRLAVRTLHSKQMIVPPKKID